MRVNPQSVQRSTYRCPARLDRCHDAALSAAELDRVGLPERCAVAGKMSASSSAGRITPAQAGGVTSSRSRSSGLGVRLIVVVATCV